MGVWAREHPKKFVPPYLLLQPLKLAKFKFCTQIGFGLSYQKKQRLGPKLAGAWAREASKKIGTRYLFLQPLKLATLFLHDISSGLSRKKFGLGRMICEGNPKRQFCCNNSEM